LTELPAALALERYMFGLFVIELVVGLLSVFALLGLYVTTLIELCLSCLFLSLVIRLTGARPKRAEIAALYIQGSTP
jgi:hypothetical protein